MKLIVRASDGSTHTYPGDYKSKSIDDWFFVSDETGRCIAKFFRPVYCIEQDQK